MQIRKSEIEIENQVITIIRLDQTDHISGGNKYYKLLPHLQKARESGEMTLLSVGGAYSNHLVALAATGKKEGFKTIGVVRGEELNENSNASLKYCSEQGMKLIFAKRNLFNSGNIDDNFLKEIRVQNEPFHFIPLGGTDDNAIKSCAQIHQYIPENTKSIVCAVGSGGTFCGLALGLKPNQELLGISAVNDFSLIEKTKFHLNNYTVDLSRIHLNFNYTFSGFGKWNEDLMNFILTFRNQYKIGIEPVYTGKAMYALMDLLRNNKVEAPITFIHTGGMQAFPELIVH